jgi:hypothetical protein
MIEFYAVTALGWGRGESPARAVTNYYAAQRRNYPHITDESLDEAWGFVWEAPEGATGFVLDHDLRWTFDDQPAQLATDAQRASAIGNVPDWVEWDGYRWTAEKKGTVLR